MKYIATKQLWNSKGEIIPKGEEISVESAGTGTVIHWNVQSKVTGICIFYCRTDDFQEVLKDE